MNRVATSCVSCLAALAAAVAAAVGGTRTITAEIVRDRFGVPHVYVDAGPGDVLAGLGYALGYAQAQDRLFEMDIFRRAARGRLAELSLVGAPYLPMDIEARRDGSTPEQLEQAYGHLSPADRRVLLAFTAGVNRYIAEVTADPSHLPFEFASQPPAPWQPTDTLAVGELELTRFAIGGGGELDNARLLADLRRRFSDAEARGIFDDVCWIDDPSAAITIAPEEQRFAPVDEIRRFAPAQMALLDRFAPAFETAAAQLDAERRELRSLAARLPIPLAAGHASNAIVVAGRLTASGAPILLGGPQTGLNIPSFFWEAGLHASGIDGHGIVVPGVPGILMGRTDRFAFTITSSADDDTDVYAEILDPRQGDRYLYRGEWLPFEHRVEVFQVAGAQPVTQDFLHTIHGPVIFIDQTAGIAFSRHRALDGRAALIGSRLLKLSLSDSLQQFLRRARRLDAGFNLHYADTAGNIAYVHAGHRPQRPPHTDPRLPLLGTGEQEWRGTLRSRPEVVNPASGLIVNWNNKPALGWPAGDQREFWGPIDRVQGLTDRLAAESAAGRPFTLDSINGVMRGAATSDVFAPRIVPFLHAAVVALAPDAGDGARLLEAENRIEAWLADGAPLIAVGDTLPHPGATLYREFRTEVQRLVFADELGGWLHEMYYPLLNEGNQEDDHGSYGTPDALFYRALQGPSATVPLSRDYFHNVDTGVASSRDEVLVAALRGALATLGARFGTDDMARWLEPKLLTSYMNIGAVNVFFGETVTERENRGSFNLLVELSQGGESRIIVPPGESGTLTAADLGTEPPHLRDQLPLYEAFLYRRIPRSRGEIEGPTSVTALAIPSQF